MVKQATSHSALGQVASVEPHGIGVYYFPDKKNYKNVTSPLNLCDSAWGITPHHHLYRPEKCQCIACNHTPNGSADTGLFVPWRCALSSVCKSLEAIFKDSRRFTIWPVAVFSRWCSRMCWSPIMHNYFRRYRYKGLSWCRPFSELQVPVMNQRCHRICRSPVSHR